LDSTAFLDTSFSVARDILRSPLVHLRLLITTPTAWLPTVLMSVMIVWAWHFDRSDGQHGRSARWFETLSGAAGFVVLIWFFHAGQLPWTESDWAEEWTFFVAWKQALANHSLPYYLATATQGTERYLANVQTPLMPYVFGLAVLPIGAFVQLHVVFVYIVGFIGTVVIRRELALGLLPWTMFVLIFMCNGHIVSHLSAGHLPWIAYFLLPWMLVSAIRICRNDRSVSVVLTCAATFAGMILIGGWHAFVWAWLFFTLVCVSSTRRILALLQVGVATALLGAARLVPGIATFGGGENVFITGYPSVAALLASLVDIPPRIPVVEAWELDAYVGYAGFLLMCAGLIPFRESPRRFINMLLLPSAMLVLLSIGHLYEHTLFQLPGFVSERVTTRLIVIPILSLTLVGGWRFDAWWRIAKRSTAASLGVLAAAWFQMLQLAMRTESWRPHAGNPGVMLPSEVLKVMPIEPVYYWAFWIGVTISIVATMVAGGLAIRMRRHSRDWSSGRLR
jgi:hypothetical protein